MKGFRAITPCVLWVALLVAPASISSDEPASTDLVIHSTGSTQTLGFGGSDPFRVTANAIVDDRLIDLPGTARRVALWSEVMSGGRVVPFYGISLDGRTMATVRETSYELQLRHAKFDPRVAEPMTAASLTAGSDSNLYLVQFVTQPLEEYREAIRALGGTLHKFIANHAHFAKMSPEVRDRVAELPFVRWVGPVHPAYKLEAEIKSQILSDADIAPRRYSIMLHERGIAPQHRVVGVVEALGGQVHGTTPRGFRIEATLTLGQVLELATLDDVMFIDRKSGLEVDLEVVRATGGADYVESVAGFTGQGVRAEVADTELDVNHPEWSAPPIIHVGGGGVDHGTSVYGILFGRGANPQARGIIPDGVGIFANSTGLLGGGPTRYTHTAELVDPLGPYRAVLQTNSTGDARTFSYTTISAEMDDILFINDILITQSQSNAGNQDSRPQAWAKNIVSGGAVDHFNTLDPGDDCWSCGSGSIGPAADGRIKPDLCFFYDLTLSAAAGGGYTEFGGTSGATPSIAGYFGLFFQMWSEQVFGNDVANPGGTVFENRPHMTTAKAAMINTATQYPFSGQSHDLTRVHQGWGVPSAQYLYDLREKIGFINETEVLENLESVEFVAFVEPGEPELRATMVYADPMGSPAASVHRVNDLTLKLTSPSSVVYWGNNGLLEGNWSTPGGAANTIDTVENVFVQNPEPGVWTVAIIASEINEDGHVESPEIDADFALVVTGADLTDCTSEGRIQLGRSLYTCSETPSIRVVDCDLNLSDAVVDTVSVTIASDTEPGGETVLLTETAETTADFRGVIPMDVADASGVLQVSHADLVTATYVDADDGMGGANVVVQDTAVLDCAPPVISNVQAINVTGDEATITWDTDEPADGLVTYGDTVPPTMNSAGTDGLVTSHAVGIQGLAECTVYAYSIGSADSAGNGATDDNFGQYHIVKTGVNNEPEYASSDTPLPIVDNTTFTSDLTVSDEDTVLDADVRLNITHTYDGDLDIFLIGPNGTRVELTSDNGGSGNDFIDTIFDDEAATAITNGSAPFSGRFRPEGSLAALDLQSAAGTWTLEVTDDAGADTGQLLDWTLILTFEAMQCGPIGQFTAHQIEVDACSTGPAGLGNGLWEAGEQVEFSVSVHNDGTDPLTGAAVTVTPLNPAVTMLEATAVVGSLAPGATAATQSPHLIAHLSDALTCGTQLEFDVAVTSAEGSWPATFHQVVGEVITERSGTVLSEDFASGAIPAGWTIIDGFADGQTWFADSSSDPAGCQSANPASPPFANSWAAVDSSCSAGGTRMDEELITPVMDLTDEPVVTLEFDHWFEWSSQRRDEIADVDIRSSNTSGQWVNLAHWTGASSANGEHVAIDISTEAFGAADVEIRFRYYNAQVEQFWYLDNVVVHFFVPTVCNMVTCAPAAANPPPIPEDMLAQQLTLDASEISVAWNAQCAPAGAKIVYGPLDQVSSYAISGAECDISNPHPWTSVPAGSLWFLLVGDDGGGVESSWGRSSGGERNGLTHSGTCGSTTKDLGGSCP
jgi:subtilisin-like proprotein convertase family protein